MINYRIFFAVAVFCLLFLLAGCFNQTVQSSAPALYRFAQENKSSVVIFRAYVNGRDSRDVSLPAGAWGKIEWMAPEGEVVASGAVVARIDLERFEQRNRQYIENLMNRENSLTIHRTIGPKRMEERIMAVNYGKRQLNARLREKQQLYSPFKNDEMWRASTDVEVARVGEQSAKMRYEMQKQVAGKGFDAPFSLRRQQIEAESRAAELEYSLRRLKSMSAGPRVDELARAQHLVDVASGELWITRNELESDQVTWQIEKQNLIFSRDMVAAQKRRNLGILEYSELSASADGVVVYPVFWGGRKARVGMDIWPGFVFMKVVSTGNLRLEAVVGEGVSAILKVGAVATLTFDAFPGRSYNAAIEFVSTTPRHAAMGDGSEFREFPVWLGINDQIDNLTIGLKATVEIEVASGTGVYIPRELVGTDDGRSVVRYYTGGRVTTLAAEVEPFDNDFVKWLNPPASYGELAYD